MSDVKFCAKSNGSTPEAEKWSKNKIKIGKNKIKNIFIHTN